MGLIGRLAVKAVTKKVGNAITKQVGNAAMDYWKTTHSREINEKTLSMLHPFQEKKLSQSNFQNHLSMKVISETIKKIGKDDNRSVYMFLDMDGNKEYEAEGHANQKLQNITLYDADGREVGSIQEKRFTFRGPFSEEENPIDYEITVHGKSLGKLKSSGNNLVLEPNKWIVQIQSLEKYHIIDNTGTILAAISSKLFSFNNITFIEYNDKSIESIILFIVIGVEARRLSRARKEKRL